MSKTIEEIHRDFGNVAERLRNKLGLPIGKQDVINALFMTIGDKLELEWVVDIWHVEMSEEEIFQTIKDFDFEKYFPFIETDYSSIEEGRLFEIKQEYRIDGVKWRIHKYDADPFPSLPHAHQVENNLKMDLSNGDCYRIRKYVMTVKKKILLKIRERAEDGGFELPPLTI